MAGSSTRRRPAAGRRPARTAGGVGADPGPHVGKRPQILVRGQLPIRAFGARVDPAGKPPERGVGVDGDDAVLAAQFGEDRPDAGRHRGFADAAFAQHPDLVVAAQDRLDGRFEPGLLALVSRWAQVDQAAGATRTRCRQPRLGRGRTGAATGPGAAGLGVGAGWCATPAGRGCAGVTVGRGDRAGRPAAAWSAGPCAQAAAGAWPDGRPGQTAAAPSRSRHARS
ncbi:hypothetical protein I552_8450 [Mycobacterium xenopi 3993]|nr:hypothetical protein I552_8450 [Mycobacterium xenopi 3993]